MYNFKVEKYIELQKRKVKYMLKVNKHSRSIKLAIYYGGEVVVTKPWYASVGAVEKFIIEKSDWVLGQIDRLGKFKSVGPKHTNDQIKKYKELTRILVLDRLEKFNTIYNFRWKRIAIRNQKTRWGSCSKKGNLNFNYKIALLPIHLAEYIVLHELCHLGEFNHSHKFWSLVAKSIPNYKEIRKELKKEGLLYC